VAADAECPVFRVVGEDGAVGAELVDQGCRAVRAGQLHQAEVPAGRSPGRGCKQDGDSGQVRENLVLPHVRVREPPRFRAGSAGVSVAAPAGEPAVIPRSLQPAPAPPAVGLPLIALQVTGYADFWHPTRPSQRNSGWAETEICSHAPENAADLFECRKRRPPLDQQRSGAVHESGSARQPRFAHYSNAFRSSAVIALPAKSQLRVRRRVCEHSQGQRLRLRRSPPAVPRPRPSVNLAGEMRAMGLM